MIEPSWTLPELVHDRKLAARVLYALQRAIVAEFTVSDWEELGYKSGEHDYIIGHDRLLRSLSFRDDDYGRCVFQFLRYVLERNRDALQIIIDQRKIRKHLERDAPDVLSDLRLNAGHVPTVAKRLFRPGEVVERALADADQLLYSSGPISCVDRLHTALHGYLGSLCSDAGIPVAVGASITALFKLLRKRHPALQHHGAQDKEVLRILNAFASVIDAINTIRNNATIAHPNTNLLGEAEANLAVNVIRTLFHYLNTKVRP